MSRDRHTRSYVRRSPTGAWIATVYFPAVPGDPCSGWHSTRHQDPESAARWLGNVIANHLGKRGRWREQHRKVLAPTNEAKP